MRCRDRRHTESCRRVAASRYAATLPSRSEEMTLPRRDLIRTAFECFDPPIIENAEFDRTY